ncbi:dihydroxyacetone kinase subunit DhaL, partial [Paraburkholderia sp.]|uniref:dihydroxyacetone kinase subunit DhaL n=1 Tax=Paraburkholderia sp. TaxID=1926495 RepID=UPI0039E42AAA
APAAPPRASRATLAREATLRRVIEAVCACLLEAEPTLTAMDQRVGDGDLGISLARGARAVLHELDTYASETTPGAVLRGISATLRRVVGGTSGPLYAVMLLRAGVTLEQSGGITARQWAAAFSAGVDALMELGGARPGDRTMVDALKPAADALQDALAQSATPAAALQAAVDAASEGASRTASMHPRRGRSSYVGDRALGHADPGAHAVALWLAAIREALAG